MVNVACLPVSNKYTRDTGKLNNPLVTTQTRIGYSFIFRSRMLFSRVPVKDVHPKMNHAVGDEGQ